MCVSQCARERDSVCLCDCVCGSHSVCGSGERCLSSFYPFRANFILLHVPALYLVICLAFLFGFCMVQSNYVLRIENRYIFDF